MNLFPHDYNRLGAFRWHRGLFFVLICFALLWGYFSVMPATASAQADRGPGEWYTVQRGDTWYSLSREFGVSVSDLQAANPEHSQLLRRRRHLL